MFYKLLGMFVWKGAKTYLRRKNGATYLPVPIVAGAIVALMLGVALAVARRDSGDSVY